MFKVIRSKYKLQNNILKIKSFSCRECAASLYSWMFDLQIFSYKVALTVADLKTKEREKRFLRLIWF